MASSSAPDAFASARALAMTHKNRFMQVFFFLIFVGSGILFVRLFLPYISAIVFAAILAAVFYPVYEAIERFFHGRKALAAGLMCLLVLLVVVLPLAGFVTLVVREIVDFLSRISAYVSVSDLHALFSDSPIAAAVAWISERFGVTIDPLQVRDALIEGGKRGASLLASSSGAIAQSFLGAILQFFLMLFTLYYLFRDGRALLAYVLDLSPLPDAEERQVMRRFREVGEAVFFGNIAVAVLQGLVAALGFMLFGVPGAFLGGALIGLLGLIPLLGGALVYVPAAALVAWNGRPLAALGFALFSFLAGVLLDHVLRPKLLQKRLKMHPLLVFFSIIGGISAFGGLGILYGPLVMTIFLALIEIYKRDFRDPQLAQSVRRDRTEGGPADPVLG